MGADFLTGIISAPLTADLKWGIKVTKKHVNAYIRDYLGDQIKNSSKEERATIKNQIEWSMQEIQNVWCENNSREAAVFTWHKYGFKLLITGGQSWGDSPSELYDNIMILEASGILTDIGFD